MCTVHVNMITSVEDTCIGLDGARSSTEGMQRHLRIGPFNTEAWIESICIMEFHTLRLHTSSNVLDVGAVRLDEEYVKIP